MRAPSGRAEDIGGQELSYAEVKAIASGNPAVLTLAEADAELQRLAILGRNHADEQYLARRAVRDLPEKIGRLEKRQDDLASDLATAEAHRHDRPIIGERACGHDDLPRLLDARLDALPLKVQQIQRFSFGRMRGLKYGMVLHPGGAADVFLEGKLVRHGELSREHRGPRAVLNAVERLLAGYAGQLEATRQELEISERQLRDHQARLGAAFPHAAYADALAELRDRLKAGLSQATVEAGGGASVAELAEQIRQLKAGHSVEAAPERTTARRITGEEPVTSRIRRKQVVPATEPAATPDQPATANPVAEPIRAEIHPLPEPTRVSPVKPQPNYRHQVVSNRRQDGRQLSLF